MNSPPGKTTVQKNRNRTADEPATTAAAEETAGAITAVRKTTHRKENLYPQNRK